MISTVVVALFCISSKVVLAGGPSSFGVIQEFNFELDLPTSIEPPTNHQIVKEAEDEVKLPEPSASISARLIPLKIAASSTPKPDGRIKCCKISNGTIGYSSDERNCGKCDRRNEFIFVDSLKSDQLCCMKNNGISKPDECVYSILGRPDPNENRGSCWDVDGTIASCPNREKLYWFKHGYCCCDGGDGALTYSDELYERPYHHHNKRPFTYK